MDPDVLDEAIARRLTHWFEPQEPFSGAEVFVLLMEEEHLEPDPEEVYDALSRMAEGRKLGLRPLHGRSTPPWERLYVFGP